jgi:hypothetical protein
MPQLQGIINNPLDISSHSANSLPSIVPSAPPEVELQALALSICQPNTNPDIATSLSMRFMLSSSTGRHPEILQVALTCH